MPLRGVREVKTHAAARRVRSEDAHRCAAGGKSRLGHTPLRGMEDGKKNAAARRVRSEVTPVRGRHSLAWRFRSCSRLGRRAHRIGTLSVHGLQRMGRKA